MNGNNYWIDSEYQAFVRLPAYELTDFSLEWRRFADRPIDLAFFITNAFDTLNIQNVSVGQPGLGVESADYGPPRMFGFRVRYTFGR